MQVLAVTATIAALAALLGAPGTSARLVRGPSDAELFIAGGGKRENGDLKYIVEIRQASFMGAFDGHLGSGVLLSPQWVLSTKDGSTPGFGRSAYVRVGKSTGTDGVKVDVEETVEEPKEKVLVLLKLKEAVKFNDATRPANLPFQSSSITSGRVRAILSGWGEGEELRAVAVTVLSDKDCRAKGVQIKNALCSNDPGTGACQGDDGSPLVQDMKNGVSKLLGVATGTKGAKCPPTTPTTYVQVADHSAWIVHNIYGITIA